ncbi:MAG: hypothetical protein LBE82_08945 [Chitinophagaceae bacterium]|jgi:hypothetical protein|nr:hypothetical protein [Chitinophagaceae bacterium]
MIALVVSCTKSNTQNIDTSLFGHWKFVGFISTQNDTARYDTLHTDCDSCMSLFISSPNKYWGRSYLNGIGRDAYTSGNQIILKPLPPNNFITVFPEGENEYRFFVGIGSPNIWEIENNYLILTTTVYSDKLLFIAK